MRRTISLLQTMIRVALLAFCVSRASLAQNASPTPVSGEHSGWVQVPGMLTKVECVHEIPKGAHLEIKEGTFTGDVTLDGILIAHYDRCSTTPILTRPVGHTTGSGSGGASPDFFGAPPPPGPLPPPPGKNPPPPPVGDGWVEAVQKDLSLASGDNIDYLAGNWTVPENPTAGGALIYLWNGIEPTPYGTWVVQPVLQWGNNGMFGNREGWVISSWLWGSNGTMVHNTPEPVSPGDQIRGTTWITNQVNLGPIWAPDYALSWQVNTADYTNGASTSLSVTTEGLQWNLAYAGVLEAYNLTACSQFPASGTTVFNYSSVYHGYPSYVLYETPWVPQYYPYGGPGCEFDATVDGDTGTLDY